MELTFNKTNENVYEAIFEATADFNIHLERKSTGILVIKQSGIADGVFDDAFNLGINAREVIDYDFGALVYPKWIKVVSGSEVVSASVNFNEGGGSGSGSGEASTIKYYHLIKDYIGTDSKYGDDVYVNWFITDHVKAFEISTGKYVNINDTFLQIKDIDHIKYNIIDIMFVHGHYAVRDNIDDDAYIKYYDSFEEYLKQRAKEYGFTINPSEYVESISYDEYWEGIDKTYTFPTDNNV